MYEWCVVGSGCFWGGLWLILICMWYVCVWLIFVWSGYVGCML